jgi:hypothetical protein
MCSKIYVSDADRYAMESLALLLRDAVKREILFEADLYQQEQTVIQKLKKSPLADCWKQYCSYSQIISREKPGENGTWLQVFAKKRSIDPYIKGAGRVSEAFPDFCEALCRFRESKQDMWLCAK